MPVEEAQLVDRIYEASVVPELWPSVLAALSEFGGADAGVLFASDADGFRFVASPNMTDTVLAYIADGWPSRTDRTTRLLAKRHAGFVTDLDVYTPEEFSREPVFRDFLLPRGFGMGAASAVSIPTGDQIIFDVERAARRGPIPPDAIARLDGVRPHLARAATLSARLRLQSVGAGAQALETVGLPAAILGRRGRLLAMNASGERLARDRIHDGPRLALKDAGADGLLGRAIAELSVAAGAAPRSIPLPASGDQPPVVLHLLPIRGAAADLFAAAEAIAVFTPLTARPVPGLSVLEGLFDLTAAEARVARGLVAGNTLAALSEDFGTTLGTVRSQLKAVMSKTGTSRQVELVQLLAGAVPPGTGG